MIHDHGPAATRRFGVVERSAHRRDQPGGTPMRFIAPASAADQLPLFVIFELVEDGRTPDGPVDPSTANDCKVSGCRLRRSTQVSSSAANTQAVRQPPAAACLGSVVIRRASRSCARTASRSSSSSTSTVLASNAA
jgi:hypothetical protein